MYPARAYWDFHEEMMERKSQQQAQASVDEEPPPGAIIGFLQRATNRLLKFLTPWL